jgi:F0F1-type ATP synthase delta subunit
MNYVIDKKVLGGIKMSAEGLVMDASLLSQMKQMTRYLLNTPLEPKSI